MIRHIVIWRLKDEAQEKTREENALLIKKTLEALPAAIPVIRSLEVGINIMASADASDIVLNTTFDSLSDLGEYQRHPEHVRFVEFLAGLKTEKRVVDYDIHA